MLRVHLPVLVVAAALAFDALPAQDRGPIQIALDIPLTGPFANIGDLYLRHAQLAVDEINRRGGVLNGRQLEILPFDNKNSPQEALLVLKQITDRRIPFVLQDGGSHIAVPLAEAVEKYNERNPEARILFLNQAGDFELSQEKCSFWTFLFYANSEMVMQVLTDFLAGERNIKRVYLINQDYAFGRQVSEFARAMIARKRPDIAVVGDAFHPLGKVKDFAPYVANIRAARADAVITGNWGNDLAFLIKAAGEAKLPVIFYTYYANSPGTPTAMGGAAIDKVKAIYRWHPNLGDSTEAERVAEYQRRFRSNYLGLPTATLFGMLAAAIEQAHTDEPMRVAQALEDMHYRTSLGEVWMRPQDHQLFAPMFVYTFTKVNGDDVRFDFEDTGIGTRTDIRLEPQSTVLPTRCKMRRPTLH